MKKLPLMITITASLLMLNPGFTESEPMLSNNDQAQQFYAENIPVYSSVPRIISSKRERFVYANVGTKGLINQEMVPQIESDKSLSFKGYLPRDGDATVMLMIKIGSAEFAFFESLRKLASAKTSTLQIEKYNHQLTVEITVIKDRANIFIPTANKFVSIPIYLIQNASNFRYTKLPEV